MSALSWLYFDVAAIFARRRFTTALDLARIALHSYSDLHLPMIAGIVLFALGLRTTVGDVGEALDTVPAVALCGGAALYLLGHREAGADRAAHCLRGGRGIHDIRQPWRWNASLH